MNRFHWALPVVLLLSVSSCVRMSNEESAAIRAPEVPTIAGSPDVGADDLSRLNGAWQIEMMMWDGIQDQSAGMGVTYLFEGDKFIMIDSNGNRQVETFKLTPGANPKAIDCWGDGGQPVPGIYSLENDTFKWCAAGGSNRPRPAAFSSETGSKQSLMVFHRQ